MDIQEQLVDAVTKLGAHFLIGIVKAIHQSFSKKKTEIIIVGFFDDDEGRGWEHRPSSLKKRKQAKRGSERATELPKKKIGCLFETAYCEYFSTRT